MVRKRRWEKHCSTQRQFTLSHVWGKSQHSAPPHLWKGGQVGQRMAGLRKENPPTSIHPREKWEQAKATCLPLSRALTSSTP